MMLAPLFRIALGLALIGSPALAHGQDTSGAHLAGCYELHVPEGQELPIYYTPPPRHFRLDLLRDVRTGAEYSAVASPRVDSSGSWRLQRWWALTEQGTVDVYWNAGFWGVMVRFPASGHAVSGEGRTWSDIAAEVRFTVHVQPVACETIEWLRQVPVQAFPRFNLQ